ncbi:MAG: GNAT family N-acetyltransferase, partial [Clostridiales bacterium]
MLTIKTLKLNKRTLSQNSKLYYLINKVYQELYTLNAEYSNFYSWYYQKVLPGIFDGTRTILLKLHQNNLAGISILKESLNEKKICTLRVSHNFRRTGIGKELLNQSFEELQTATPLITVSSKHLDEFRHLFG